MNVGIVGHEAAKFTPVSRATAESLIRRLLLHYYSDFDVTVVSGGCPLGGIDEWAEQIAVSMGLSTLIFHPKVNNWEEGFRPRNIQIATHSDVLHNILVDSLPATYRGKRFPNCYHCHTADHVKSGGCWTAKYARNLGKEVHWHVLNHDANDED